MHNKKKLRPKFKQEFKQEEPLSETKYMNTNSRQNELNSMAFAGDTTLHSSINLVEDKIELLSLNKDLGREDLNQNAQKVEDKINEIIKKI